MQHSTQNIWGESIQYFFAGRGPALLFLHAFGTPPKKYRALLEQLSKRFEVIAPRMYGLGYLKRQPVSLDEYAELTHAFSDALGIDNPSVVGHSVGGGVAIKLGASKIVGINAVLPTGLSGDDFFRLFIGLRYKTDISSGFIEMARRRYGHAFQFLDDVAGFSYETVPVPQPTLMLHAGDDEIFQLNEDTKRQLEGAFDDLDVRVVEDRKHLWPIDHPNEVSDHVLRFVSD